MTCTVVAVATVRCCSSTISYSYRKLVRPISATRILISSVSPYRAGRL
jgi:hypothetical protein